MNPRLIVTTSWDDGHILDLKLADLLKRYQIPGTFYVAPEDQEFEAAKRLTAAQILDLSKHFEIGAHTITHPRLPQVDDATAEHEIAGSKTILESIIHEPVTTFCYPGGAYLPQHVAMARKAGYTYARTVKRFHQDAGADKFTAPTTLHAYRHWSDILPIARFARFSPRKCLQYWLNWDQLAIAMFDDMTKHGGVFHLWGHSWEIEANGDWIRLENVLRHISGNTSVHYVTNGELP